ncbi:MAG: class III signal peptide-containing protein [Methanobacteriaceae archaeon]|nr:class III signal peptide-containing protein [Methanobacteriaceae archaeon]
MKFKSNLSEIYYKILKDNNAQGAVELLLLLGGVLVVVLILVSIYKSYLSDLTLEVSSSELNELNNSFNELANKFD